jgi:hypothetical protein
VAANGQFYTGNSAYGQGNALGAGFVVYSGTGHSATVTGLRPGTFYYITNAEYNSDGTSIAYNTRGTSMSVATRSAPVAPLPVELTAFSGTLDARNRATLRWSTATEHNSDYFALERSPDGVAFAEVGRVQAAGFSTQPLAYQWPDPKPLEQRTYYRLRQTDRSGAVSFSQAITLVPTARVARQLELYPNPSAGEPIKLLAASYDGEVLALRITDVLGRLLVTQTLRPTEALYLAPLPLPAGLSPGTYLLTLAITNNPTPIQKRFVISD